MKMRIHMNAISICLLKYLILNTLYFILFKKKYRKKILFKKKYRKKILFKKKYRKKYITFILFISEANKKKYSINFNYKLI